ncbi:MAG TPA: hypothetical protein VK735_40040 [Pseudonocardia sp.]|uniref:hypothetical protein n=1 Tax=Pseudonocardia sp. TaxID=60912 RepID=UPI002C39D4C5|nr:hypothetical protein [Pseudonocardia sp.]HTF53676.1 hypothetical protein [Pseudonocardia sp.]
MRVLNIPGGADTGGNGWRTKDAFDRYLPEWTYNLCVSSPKYMLYPVDRPWSEARQLWEAADVVHVRNNYEIERVLGVQPRPTVIQHHGTHFRTEHNQLRRIAAARRSIQIASTLDLWLIAPDETEWLPSPYDLDWLHGFRLPDEVRPDDGVFRIAHAPTDRRVKSTERLIAAVERLRNYVPVELDLIENASWQDCLRRKGRADVYFDQVILGYGNNAIESWGMGVPVIAGAADATLDEMTRRFGSLPFYPADQTTIFDALMALADPETRATWAKRGEEHVWEFHDEAAVVPQLQDMYQRAYDAGA